MKTAEELQKITHAVLVCRIDDILRDAESRVAKFGVSNYTFDVTGWTKARIHDTCAILESLGYGVDLQAGYKTRTGSVKDIVTLKWS